jgi:hypothetical protein
MRFFLALPEVLRRFPLFNQVHSLFSVPAVLTAASLPCRTAETHPGIGIAEFAANVPQ